MSLRDEPVELVDLTAGFEAWVEAGAVIEVPDEVGERMLEQPANWVPADDDEPAAAELEDDEPATPDEE